MPSSSRCPKIGWWKLPKVPAIVSCPWGTGVGKGKGGWGDLMSEICSKAPGQPLAEIAPRGLANRQQPFAQAIGHVGCQSETQGAMATTIRLGAARGCLNAYDEELVSGK